MVSIRAALALGLALCLNLRAAPPAEEAPTEAETARYEAGFSAAQQATRSFRATLRQTLALQGLDRPVVSAGELSYLAPDKLLIHFTDPAGEWMRIAGGRLDLQKAGAAPVHRDLGQGGASNAATMLDFFSSDSAKWHRDFQVSMAREGGLLRVTLVPWRVPTAQRQGVDRIVTTLRLPGYDVAAIEVSMNPGNRILFEFLNGKRNAPVDPKLFAAP